MSDRMKIASCKIEMKKQEQIIIFCNDIVLGQNYCKYCVSQTIFT